MATITCPKQSRKRIFEGGRILRAHLYSSKYIRSFNLPVCKITSSDSSRSPVSPSPFQAFSANMRGKRMFDYQTLCRVRNQGPILCTSVCDNRTAKARGIRVLVARGDGATSPPTIGPSKNSLSGVTRPFGYARVSQTDVASPKAPGIQHIHSATTTFSCHQRFCPSLLPPEVPRALLQYFRYRERYLTKVHTVPQLTSAYRYGIGVILHARSALSGVTLAWIRGYKRGQVQ